MLSMQVAHRLRKEWASLHIGMGPGRALQLPRVQLRTIVAMGCAGQAMLPVQVLAASLADGNAAFALSMPVLCYRFWPMSMH
eukprot:1157842-Pelagomonas_calceolata.AAC.14